MEAGELSFIVLHATGAVCFLIACAFAFMMLWTPVAYNRFCGLAVGNREFYPEHALSMLTYVPPPWYTSSRLWRTALLAVGFAGATYGCYGIIIQVLFWMPRDWRTDDGVWFAVRLATGSSWMLAWLIIAFLHRTWQQLFDLAEAGGQHTIKRMREERREVTENPVTKDNHLTAAAPVRKPTLTKEQLEASVAAAQEARRKNPPLKEIELYRSLGFEVVEHPVGSGFWFKKNGGYMEGIN